MRITISMKCQQSDTAITERQAPDDAMLRKIDGTHGRDPILHAFGECMEE